MKKKIFDSLKLMRIHQWVKNILVFAPLFFSGKLGDFHLLFISCQSFFSFSFIASAIYILNDYKDIALDRSHPKKKLRPLASGALSKKYGLGLMLFLVGFSLLSSLFLKQEAFFILLSYFIINIAYCFYLKNKAVVDVVTIASGFVLRLMMGSVVTDIRLSMWILLITFLLALFIALAKRRDDVLIFNKTGQRMRKSIKGYNLEFIDSSMMIMATVVIVSYIQYTTSQEVLERINNEYLYLTVFFVLIGILRYLQITLVEKRSGSPINIALKDKPMIMTLILWVLSFYWILYL